MSFSKCVRLPCRASSKNIYYRKVGTRCCTSLTSIYWREETVFKKVEWNTIKKIVKSFKKNYKKIILSVDTRKSDVMEKGIKQGVKIINDVSGLSYDKKYIHQIS